jgi:hypothetical protein
VTISDKSTLLAHAELMKPCDAPESNMMMIGHQNSKNVLAGTSSPSGISSTVVHEVIQSEETGQVPGLTPAVARSG